ncbi:MAG: hypothetical protein KBC72_13610, partial [Acinetobacter sp.]|nr:hypothetical protein [Acinetobacter sp.]
LYQPHAFSVSMSREIMLEKDAWYPTDHDENWHGTFGSGFDYMHTFDTCGTTITNCCAQLGSLPFWASDNSNTMSIGDNSGDYDIDGYQMGLGPITNTDGTVTLNPIIFQAGADFLLYVGAHRNQRGFFFKAHAPVGVISINPNLTFTNTIDPQDYQPGLFNTQTGASPAVSAVPAPYSNIQQAFQGGIGYGWLDPMTHGLININTLKATTFGDAELVAGYNLFANESGHLGIGVRLSIPTGNKAQGVYVLEPLFGRNGHWGIGGELIAHWKLWNSNNNRYVQFFFDGDALHLCKSEQVRSFDLKENGLGSKYLLLARYIGNTANTAGNFQNEILNAVNITTIGVGSTFAIEGNFALGIQCFWDNWSFEAGYEGWGRTCEELTLCSTCQNSINYNDFAVLGRQTPYSTATDTAVFLGLCQPTATINESVAQINTFAPTSIVKDACLSANRLAEAPEDALDIDAQCAQAVYTSKAYAEFRYTWSENEYAPYLAITGGAEIPNIAKNQAVKFWNIGFNGGLAF